jgi:hypothetical protein
MNPQIWLAFHGVGQNTEAFKHFVNQNNSKIYSFGLFYHEKNQTHLKNSIENTRETTLNNWLILMQRFLEEEKINFQDYSINVIGFSLGARPALQFVSNLSKLPSKFISINRIILIAPETLAISRWYRFGTQTMLGRLTLKTLVSSTRFKRIIISLSSLFFPKNARKIIHHKIHNGINSLASAWLAYRPFEISAKDWIEIYDKQKEKITIVTSQNDNFVDLKKIQRFIRRNSSDEGKSIKWIISQSSHSHLLKEFEV